MDSNALKDILDLQDYVNMLGEDRPKLSVMLEELGINPRTMWNAVRVTAMNASITYPETAIEVVNQLFKLGVTIGYKYAIKKQMEEEFGGDDGPN